MGMSDRFFKNGELRDEKIIAALKKARKWYENGAIIEVRDLLLEIVDSIDEFESEQEW